MKILTIIGSAKNGNTSEIIRCFKEELKKLWEYEFEDLYLEDFKIDFCTGCHNCILVGEDKCLHYNEVKVIEDKILVSDILILATPGYMFSVTGIMKNFLDHVAYNCHRPKYFGKKIFYISSCNKWQEKGVFIPMQTWGSAAGFCFMGKMYIDMLPLPFTEKEKMKRRNKIKANTVSFARSSKSPVSIRPDIGGIMMFRVLRTISKIAPKIMKADYKYFTEIKAYEKETKWYVSAKISPIKIFLVNIFEKKIEKAINKIIDKNEIDNCKGRFRNKL